MNKLEVDVELSEREVEMLKEIMRFRGCKTLKDTIKELIRKYLNDI